MSHPFDSDEPIPGITGLIALYELRYSSQHDPALWLCRDCGGIVKDGWLSMHDGLHDAIGYPAYPDSESSEQRVEDTEALTNHITQYRKADRSAGTLDGKEMVMSNGKTYDAEWRLQKILDTPDIAFEIHGCTVTVPVERKFGHVDTVREYVKFVCKKVDRPLSPAEQQHRLGVLAKNINKKNRYANWYSARRLESERAEYERLKEKFEYETRA